MIYILSSQTEKTNDEMVVMDFVTNQPRHESTNNSLIFLVT